MENLRCKDDKDPISLHYEDYSMYYIVPCSPSLERSILYLLPGPADSNNQQPRPNRFSLLKDALVFMISGNILSYPTEYKEHLTCLHKEHPALGPPPRPPPTIGHFTQLSGGACRMVNAGDAGEAEHLPPQLRQSPSSLDPLLPCCSVAFAFCRRAGTESRRESV